MIDLGKIEKPDVERYAGKRKLYCVRNVYLMGNVHDEYKGLYHKYWDEVVQQIKNIEVVGKITKIFCESIYLSGDEALDTIGSLSVRAGELIRKKIEEGGVLLPLEKKEIFGPFLDWGNCLMLVRTKEVFEQVNSYYTDLLNKRFQHIVNVIESNLNKGESGLIIIREEDRQGIRFQEDIEVFLVTPPSYDELLKWFRERQSKKENKE